ncbi:hypothetical protein HO133_007324 [Letharia lupina]|uniref:Uncharacterized protein n=1 Tax=Letharia lupina TaxID=560253 RepID=A0A8H6FIK7_9LECA|nr:uncharacterized protein HO133_007324 [Letharia lupina]KAF6229208.1 hypothetical protein HO133_007324 [Letharia lupina]
MITAGLARHWEEPKMQSTYTKRIFDQPAEGALVCGTSQDSQHAGPKAATYRMQDPRPDLLGQNPRHQRRHRAAGTAQRRHGRQPAHLQPLRDQRREHGGRGGVHGPEQEADDGHGDGVADGVGHEPDEQLEGRGAEDQGDDGALLADAVGGVREQEAAEGDAGPEARGDVADAGGGGVPVGDEEGDDPARDADLGALVAEDEEGAQDGGFVRPMQAAQRGRRVGEVG